MYLISFFPFFQCWIFQCLLLSLFYVFLKVIWIQILSPQVLIFFPHVGSSTVSTNVFHCSRQPRTDNQSVNTGTKMVPLPTLSNHTSYWSISLPVNQGQRTIELVPSLAVIETGLILQAKILATAVQSIFFYIVSSVIPFPDGANSFFFYMS